MASSRMTSHPFGGFGRTLDKFTNVLLVAFVVRLGFKQNKAGDCLILKYGYITVVIVVIMAIITFTVMITLCSTSVA